LIKKGCDDATKVQNSKIDRGLAKCHKYLPCLSKSIMIIFSITNKTVQVHEFKYWYIFSLEIANVESFDSYF